MLRKFQEYGRKHGRILGSSQTNKIFEIKDQYDGRTGGNKSIEEKTAMDFSRKEVEVEKTELANGHAT